MGDRFPGLKYFAAAGFAMVLLVPIHLEAQSDLAREFALLPPYCKHTWGYRDSVPGGNDGSEISRWQTIIGEGMFIHMHHYCNGLRHRNNAKLVARSPAQRKQEWELSIPEFDYVLQNAPPNFVLLPEMLTMKGESLMALDRGTQAIPVLQRAIELKPDYWPPYIAISDYFKNAGDIAKAREWLQKGLSSSPNTKTLQNRLAELDGMKGKRAASHSTGAPAGKESPAAKPPAEKTRPEPQPNSEESGSK